MMTTANTAPRSARLGRLRQKGTRCVRMTKTTRVWVARDSTNHPERNSAGPAANGPSMIAKRGEVEDRADGSEGDHESSDEFDVPMRWAGHEFGVDQVGRDCHLAAVVEEVVQQDLAGEHREERQERGSDSGAEHVPEVRRRAHEDVLDGVGEGAASFADAVGEHAEVFFEEDDVGRVFGDVRSGLDRNPDVGGVERDRVVHAITEKRDVTVRGAVRADESGLLLGTDAGEDRGLDDSGAECVVVECGDICSGHRGADVEAEVTTDLLGDDGIVARDDLDGDAEVGESLEGCGGIEFGLVQEDEIADQGEVVLVGRTCRVGAGRGAGCDGHNPPPGSKLGIEGRTSRLGDIDAGRQDGFRRAFRDEQPAVDRIVDEDRRHPAIMIEWDSRNPVHTGEGHRRRARRLPERDIKGVATYRVTIFNGGFVAEQAQSEHLIIRSTADVHCPDKTDVAFGECAGLVGQEDLDVTEILDAHETLHQHTLLGETARSGRQARRHDRREQLRGDTDRDRQ